MSIPLNDEQFSTATTLICDAMDDNVLTAWCRVQDDARWHRAALAKARAEIAKLRGALKELMAWQPIVNYAEGWTAAMKKANAALASTAPKPDAVSQGKES